MPGDLVDALRRHGVREVDDSPLARAMYATDASLYRVPPQVVARPRDEAEVLAALAAARETGVPVTMRGAGTSIAGNAVGPGLVLDVRRHLHAVVGIDAEQGTARVQPGVVHAALQKAAAPHGLRFGPDPSTHTRCTIGGMIGNNACGSRALGYGRTADNVVAMRVALPDGTVLETSAGHQGLDELVGANLATVRTEFGRFGRQVSGYSFEHLLPENGRDLTRFLVGSEGTLAVVLEAEVRMVRDAPARALAVLGFPDMATAADAVPDLLAHPLVACEGLDRRITDVVARFGGHLPELPGGAGWLFAEVTADTEPEARALAQDVARTAGVPHRVVTDPAEQARLWRIREDGAGLAARSLRRQAKSGWEDAAVPPANLGAYLRDFEALLREAGLEAAPYGHFGDGCVHARIDFDLDGPSTGPGRAGFRRFVEAAAELTASHEGSMSGEHGDGRARSSVLDRMYSPDALRLMGRAKHLLDPDGLLNPGVLVDPVPFDADLRVPGRSPRTALRLTHDGGSFATAVHRCTGVGKCTADNTATGGVMCPSYLATGEEQDSTRGRARVLQELVDGDLVGGFDHPAVTEALDLCLSCKGCASDCPTGIDMATYKSEALHQRYRRRLRPRSHYALGRLPTWARMTPPKLANALLRSRAVARAAKAAAGVDQRRSLPSFSARPLRGRSTPTQQPDVWLWADSFTDRFAADAGRAAIELLEGAGLRVAVIEDKACCGLTWITTGQLTAARRIIGRAVETLHPYVASGVPVLALEPSCLATLRSDAEQLSDDPRAAEVAAGVRSLAELLTELEVPLPDLAGVQVVAQPHCHHHAVVGWATDRALLERTGARVTHLGGCCGLAGNFGVEQGHYEVSVKVAETALLPAVREQPDAVVLADGFSCRTQLVDLAPDRTTLTLAELLLRGAGG